MKDFFNRQNKKTQELTAQEQQVLPIPAQKTKDEEIIDFVLETGVDANDLLAIILSHVQDGSKSLSFEYFKKIVLIISKETPLSDGSIERFLSKSKFSQEEIEYLQNNEDFLKSSSGIDCPFGTGEISPLFAKYISCDRIRQLLLRASQAFNDVKEFKDMARKNFNVVFEAACRGESQHEKFVLEALKEVWRELDRRQVFFKEDVFYYAQKSSVFSELLIRYYRSFESGHREKAKSILTKEDIIRHQDIIYRDVCSNNNDFCWHDEKFEFLFKSYPKRVGYPHYVDVSRFKPYYKCLVYSLAVDINYKENLAASLLKEPLGLLSYTDVFPEIYNLLLDFLIQKLRYHGSLYWLREHHYKYVPFLLEAYAKGKLEKRLYTIVLKMCTGAMEDTLTKFYQSWLLEQAKSNDEEKEVLLAFVSKGIIFEEDALIFCLNEDNLDICNAFIRCESLSLAFEDLLTDKLIAQDGENKDLRSLVNFYQEKFKFSQGNIERIKASKSLEARAFCIKNL